MIFSINILNSQKFNFSRIQKFSFHSRFHIKLIFLNFLFSFCFKNYKIRPTGENDCEKTQHIKYRTQTESCRTRGEFSKDFVSLFWSMLRITKKKKKIQILNFERAERAGLSSKMMGRERNCYLDELEKRMREWICQL